MQIGQTIWAIDPCEMTFTKEKALIVGKAYTVKSFNKISFEITSEIDTLHTFLLKNFEDYFSLTPPEGKGGVSDDDIKNEARNFDKSMLAGFKREHTPTEFYSTSEQAFIEGAKWMRGKLK